MQDVSCELLMLCPSENPQASLDIFSQPHHHPSRSCIHRKAINKNKPSLSSGVLPSRQQSSMSRLPGTPPPSVYQVTHDTALQAAEFYVQQYILMRMNYHITRTQYTLLCLEGNHITSTPQALRCLEGTTMSNRGQRPRIRALPPYLCLEGSTPQDRSTFFSTTD